MWGEGLQDDGLGLERGETKARRGRKTIGRGDEAVHGDLSAKLLMNATGRYSSVTDCAAVPDRV